MDNVPKRTRREVRVAVLLLALVVSFAAAGRAEVLVECGASQGWAYYTAGGVIAPADAGWAEDRITGGKTALLFDGTNAQSPFDVLYTDSSGGTRTAKSDGLSVTLLAIDNAGMLVLVLGDKLVETYHFTNEGLILTQSKHNEMILKDGIFVSDCQWLEQFSG